MLKPRLSGLRLATHLGYHKTLVQCIVSLHWAGHNETFCNYKPCHEKSSLSSYKDQMVELSIKQRYCNTI